MKHFAGSTLHSRLSSALFILLIVLSVDIAPVNAQYMVAPPPPETQGQVDGQQIVPATVFPLGALAQGAKLDSMQKVGMNTVTVFANAMEFLKLGGGPGLTDTLGALTGGGWLAPYADIGENTFREERMYTFSGYERAGDRPYDYGVVPKILGHGAFFWMTGDMVDGEYKINETDTLLPVTLGGQDTQTNSHYSGNYILRVPKHQVTGENWSGNLDRKLYAQYYDFIYRFDTTNVVYRAASPTTVLYTVEVWIRGAKTNEAKYNVTVNGTQKWQLFDTVYSFPITKAIYLAALDSVNDPEWWGSDLNNTLARPKHLNNVTYARLHMVFDSLLMDRYFNAGRSDSDTLASRYKGEEAFFGQDSRGKPMFDVRVRRNPATAVPIFVKGMRVRNGGAEKLLTGKLDYDLAKKFDLTARSMYEVVDNYGQITEHRDTLPGNYYNRLLNIHVEHEPGPARYYIISYLDRYAKYHTDYQGKPYKRVTSFSPINPREIRLIWDDILWKPNQQEAAPEHIYRNIDYQSEGAVYLGIPDDVFPATGKTGLNLLTQYILPDADLAKYERQHDSLITHRYRSHLIEANEAAFKLGTKPIPFWVMAQAYISLTYRNPANNKVTNDRDPDTVAGWKAYLVNRLKAKLLDTSINTCDEIGEVQYDIGKIWDTTTLGYDRAHVTSEQIRL